MDLFEEKMIAPMLIKDEVAAFDDPEYLFELKFDGIRCVAFLDANGKTEFYNKRRMLLNPHFPELLDIHQKVSGRCILDGEVFIMRDGRPNFPDVQKRALTSDRYKIQLQAKRHPASFVAYDILYYRKKDITNLPLIERKKKLESVIKQESAHFTYSRYTIGHGIKMFEMTGKQNLEGIIAKRLDSKYYQGKKTKDWLKIKNMLDDDFIICGYILKEAYIRTLVLGQYQDNDLVYKGHVTGISKAIFNQISSLPKTECPFTDIPKSNEKAVWVKRELVCKVKFMEYTPTGGMRQPVFVSLRDDKVPDECKVNM